MKQNSRKKYELFLEAIGDVIRRPLKKFGINKAFIDKETVRALHVRQNAEQITERLNNRYIGFVALIIMLALVGFLVYELTRPAATNSGILERPFPGEGKKMVELIVNSEDILVNEEFTVDISEKKLTGEKKEEMYERLHAYIEKTVLGENESAERVNRSLNLITTVPGTPVKLDWDNLDTEYLFMDGSIRYDKLEGSVPVCIEVGITYFDEKTYYMFPVILCPIDKSEREAIIEKLTTEVERIDADSKEEGNLHLPEEVEGHLISWSEKKDNTAYFMLILGTIAAILIIPGLRKDMGKKLKQREAQMEADFSEIISKFTLLLVSGMTCRGAWARICKDYLSKESEENCHYAYEEMIVTDNQLKLGVSEMAAYEEFGKRCGLACYQKFGTILSRNIKRGNHDIIELLDQKSKEAFEDRIAAVKIMGEQAGTKLLFPMLGEMCLVILIIVVPALGSM